MKFEYYVFGHTQNVNHHRQDFFQHFDPFEQLLAPSYSLAHIMISRMNCVLGRNLILLLYYY